MASEAQAAGNIIVKVNNLMTKQCELHECLRLCMRLSRWAGVFPVEGLNKRTISGLRFNARSVYFIYFLATVGHQSVICCFITYYFFMNDIKLDHITNLLFYLISWLTAVFLLKLAMNWPRLMKRASEIESCVMAIRSKSDITKTNNRIVCFIMIVALFEHIFSLVSKVNLILDENPQFAKIGDISCFREFMKAYFKNNTYYIFTLISYSDLNALMYEIGTVQSTFLWNFTDALTLCISIYLISYFQDLNEFIEKQEKEKIIVWKQIRVYYSYLVELVHEVDRNMCYLVLLSLFTNLFFICVQLFNVIHARNGQNVLEHYVYYIYSFLFLFTRSIVTSLVAANIHTVSRRPIVFLQNVPSSEYTLDVQRFIRQIRYTTTALSGLYFYVTRAMILTVIATVVKYELVLLQFQLRNIEYL